MAALPRDLGLIPSTHPVAYCSCLYHSSPGDAALLPPDFHRHCDTRDTQASVQGNTHTRKTKTSKLKGGVCGVNILKCRCPFLCAYFFLKGIFPGVVMSCCLLRLLGSRNTLLFSSRTSCLALLCVCGGYFQCVFNTVMPALASTPPPTLQFLAGKSKT